MENNKLDILLLDGQNKKQKNCTSREILKKNINIITKIFFKIINHLPLTSKFSFIYSYTFGEWKNNLNIFKLIIIYDSFGIYTYNVIKYLNEIKYKGRIILYYRNPLYLRDTLQLSKVKKLNCEIWSYSQYDCEHYGLFFNPNPLPEMPILENEKNDILYDFIFIGMNKGRKSIINKLCNELSDYKIYKKIISKNKYTIPYSDYINYCNKAKVIIDISDEKAGPTTRCTEGLLLKRKVITNCKSIKNYKFYNKNNIFIYGEDNLKNINDFLERDFLSIEKDVLDYYSFSNWLNRFVQC